MLSKKRLSLLSALAAIMVLVLALSACAPTATPTEAPEEPAATEEMSEEEMEEPTEEEMAEEEMSFTVGVSNGFVGSEWRTQMVADLEEVAAELGVELVIESADVDVQGQIQQIQNLVNRGVDAIIVNPNSQDGLNSAIEEAVDAGVLVIAVDQEISAEGAYNVVIDQNEWAQISARWLMQQLNSEGDIVLIEGFVGHPANEARMAGVETVLENNPDVEVVGRDTGQWDQATGQQVMSDFLASLPNIDGVWTQDGMAEGALQAVITADPETWPVMVGEARAGYIQLWYDVKQDRDFSSIGVVNPPGVGASGLRVAYEILSGGTVDESQLAGPFGNSLYVPIPYAVTDTDFTSDVVEIRDFETVYEEVKDQPASYTLDGIITQEQAAEFMQ